MNVFHVLVAWRTYVISVLLEIIEDHILHRRGVQVELISSGAIKTHAISRGQRPIHISRNLVCPVKYAGHLIP